MSSDIDWGRYIDTVKDEEFGKKSTLWKFNYDNGFCYAIGVNHPSSRGFSPNQWCALVESFIKEDYSNR